jgi:hypothetical protein
MIIDQRFIAPVKISLIATMSLLALLLLAACGGGEPEDVSFELSIAAGGLAGDESTFVAKQDDTVSLNFSADVHGEVHLHGYDLTTDVGPGEPSSITFVADATGRYAMEFHPQAAAETHCDDVDVTGMAVRLSLEPASEPGHYVVSVEADNFEFSLASGSHWHLTSDGETIGMFYEPSAEVELGMGMHEIVAQLNTSEHCALPVSDIMVVGQDVPDDGMGMDDHDGEDEYSHDAEDEHVHEGTGDPFSIGALEIRPR